MVSRSRAGDRLLMDDLLAHFPAGATPRPEQARLLAALGRRAGRGRGRSAGAPRVLRGRGAARRRQEPRGHDPGSLERRRLPADLAEAAAGPVRARVRRDLALVKGRDNYVCERYHGAPVPTSRGMCRRPRGPACGCPYVRAKQAALGAPIFCTNTAYFATLRHWHAEQLRRRRLLDRRRGAQPREPARRRLHRPLLARGDARAGSAARCRGCPRPTTTARSWAATSSGWRRNWREVDRRLEALRPPELPDELFLAMPPTREEQDLLEQREQLESALARVTFFLEAGGPRVDRALSGPRGRRAGAGAADAWPPWRAALFGRVRGDHRAVLGVPRATGRCWRSASGCEESDVRVFSTRIAVRARAAARSSIVRSGVLSQATRARLEPGALRGGRGDPRGAPTRQGTHPRRLVRGGAPARRTTWACGRRARPGGCSGSTRRAARPAALDLHRASALPTVLVSPSLREGVDLPDDFLRFQVLTKLPYPDLGDPWTAARRQRDPRWYAVETAKALLQAYGRSCRHAEDHGVTYLLDAQFARFLQRYRVLLPEWFLDAAEPALRVGARRARSTTSRCAPTPSRLLSRLPRRRSRPPSGPRCARRPRRP